MKELVDLIRASQGHKIYSAKALAANETQYRPDDYISDTSLGRNFPGFQMLWIVDPCFPEYEDYDESIEYWRDIEQKVREIDGEAAAVEGREPYSYFPSDMIESRGFAVSTFGNCSNAWTRTWAHMSYKTMGRELAAGTSILGSSILVNTFKGLLPVNQQEAMWSKYRANQPIIEGMGIYYFGDNYQGPALPYVEQYEVEDLDGEYEKVLSVPHPHHMNRRMLLMGGGWIASYLVRLPREIRTRFMGMYGTVDVDEFEIQRRALLPNRRNMEIGLAEDLSLDARGIYLSETDDRLDWRSLEIAVERFKEAFLHEIHGEEEA